jgi:hypothetical protein
MLEAGCPSIYAKSEFLKSEIFLGEGLDSRQRRAPDGQITLLIPGMRGDRVAVAPDLLYYRYSY